jgi:hypothetical protein
MTKLFYASDVDLSLPDTVKSVNPVTENGGVETVVMVEVEPKSAFLSELQDSNGDWDGEEEEHGNLDGTEALAALVKSARSESGIFCTAKFSPLTIYLKNVV